MEKVSAKWQSVNVSQLNFRVPEWHYDASCHSGEASEVMQNYIDTANEFGVSFKNEAVVEIELAAKAICAECEVIDDCKKFALQSADREIKQILGGMTTQEILKERATQGIKKQRTGRTRGRTQKT